MPSIAHCLRQPLAALGQDTLQLQALTKTVHSLLPPQLALQCQVSHFSKEGRLLLTTSQATWASQLNYFIPELRDKLRKEAGLHQLSSIKVKVQDPSLYKKTTPKAPFTLSDQTKATIISESQLCSYQPLKKALLHLALGKEV